MTRSTNKREKKVRGRRFWGVVAATSAGLTALNSTSAGVILTTNDIGVEGAGATNAAVSGTYASNTTATSVVAIDTDGDNNRNAVVTDGGAPNVSLTWDAIANGSVLANIRWEFHAWAGAGVANTGGGVLQLNNSAAVSGSTSPFTQNVVHRITFTPTAGTGVTIESFNFIGDTNNDTYRYDWQIVRTSDAAVVASGQTTQWTTNTAVANSGAPTVAPNFTGALGTAYRLELAQSAGSTGNAANIAIDNLAFSQIPEPGSALLALPLMGLLAARRQRTVR